MFKPLSNGQTMATVDAAMSPSKMDGNVATKTENDMTMSPFFISAADLAAIGL
jgi:hypothetical protein